MDMIQEEDKTPSDESEVHNYNQRDDSLELHHILNKVEPSEGHKANVKSIHRIVDSEMQEIQVYDYEKQKFNENVASKSRQGFNNMPQNCVNFTRSGQDLNSFVNPHHNQLQTYNENPAGKASQNLLLTNNINLESNSFVPHKTHASMNQNSSQMHDREIHKI